MEVRPDDGIDWLLPIALTLASAMIKQQSEVHKEMCPGVVV